jgi:hypothetical protein
MKAMPKVDLHTVQFISKMVQLIVVNGFRTREMAKALKFGLIPLDTKVAGRTTKQMVTVSLFTLMVIFTRVSG